MCRSCAVQTPIRTVSECRPPQHYAAGQARIVHDSRRAASAHTQLRMNFEHPTSNAQCPSARANRAGDLDVGRSALDVGRSSVHAWPSGTRTWNAGGLPGTANATSSLPRYHNDPNRRQNCSRVFPVDAPPKSGPLSSLRLCPQTVLCQPISRLSQGVCRS